MRKTLIILFSILFVASIIGPVYPYSQLPEFLCEVGMRFYQNGRYEEALTEFKKALLIQFDYAPALKYIQLIENRQVAAQTVEGVVFPSLEPAYYPKEKVMPSLTAKERLEIRNLEKEMILKGKSYPKVAQMYALPSGLTEVVAPAKVAGPLILRLDESFSQIKQPIEIEQGKSIVIIGKNIQRFLATQPEILTLQRQGADELLVKGNSLGYTYLYVWDDNGRWQTEFLGIFPKPEGPTYEEAIRRQEETARNFKLRYTIDWSSIESGRRIETLERSSYYYTHGLSLTGQTPYGDFYSSGSVRRLREMTDLTYFTIGLNDAQIGPFKGFNFRSFDYFTPFSNLALPGVDLRGALLTSSAFNKKLDYTAFWGRESGGRYGNLSPGLNKTEHSFLEGVNLNYSPVKKQNYKFSLVHGWGRDRQDYLNAYDYDLISTWNFNKGGLTYELANDSETFAHLINARYARPKINLTAELRNIDKDFYSIVSRGWRAGELGGIVNLDYKPTNKLAINSQLNVYRDRLYPAEDNYHRWNEDFNYGTTYKVDALTILDLNYSLQNELGRLSQSRYQSSGLNISKTVKFIKDISAYAGYAHQENKSFTAHSSDYINNKTSLGMRFSIVGELYYYLNKEFNWLEERYTGGFSRPNALETGLDWSEQIGKSPFYGNWRFTYRDEEDTEAGISFLAGEDYIEGYSELAYRPNSGNEIFGSCRVRNVWADNPNVTKRIEANFYAGMRYVWDTGLRWDSVGNIEGYVFKDYNSDGLRQRDEPPLEGVKILLGKDKMQVTDIFGYYKFKGVKGRKAFVSIDTSTIPAGFVLTVPYMQETSIAHHRSSEINFGIVSRSEISGYIFEDMDDNGEYGRNDIGVKGAVLTLEDGQKAVTDANGRYYFSRASVGEHAITLDLKSLPVYYLPKTALTKKITLFEGVTYIYNIPLRKIQE